MSAPAHSCAGVVLAGGASGRMGRDKSMLDIGGQPLVSRVVRRLRLAVPRVVVVGPQTLRPVVPDCTVVPDRVPGLGPLGGLASALAEVEAAWLFMVACDMPFVAAPLVRAMLDLAMTHVEAQAVVLQGPKGWEPLHAVYARSCEAVVGTQLRSADHALTALLERLTVRAFPAHAAAALDPRGLSAFNANTPDEWHRALRLADEESEEFEPPGH
jgi:molybdopterin-guanine dinucleotide biosynthesis protein A